MARKSATANKNPYSLVHPAFIWFIQHLVPVVAAVFSVVAATFSPAFAAHPRAPPPFPDGSQEDSSWPRISSESSSSSTSASSSSSPLFALRAPCDLWWDRVVPSAWDLARLFASLLIQCCARRLSARSEQEDLGGEAKWRSDKIHCSGSVL